MRLAFSRRPSAPQPRREVVFPLGGGAPSGFAQILVQHVHALAIHRDHQDGIGLLILLIRTRTLLALGIKCLEVPRCANRQLLELPLRYMGPGRFLQPLDAIIERRLGCFDRHPAPYLQRVLLIGEIERSIKRVKTRLLSRRAIAGSTHFNCSKDRFQAARMHLGWHQRCACGIPNRFLLLRLPRLAHFRIRLHYHLPQHILHHLAHLSFNIAVAQLVRLLG